MMAGDLLMNAKRWFALASLAVGLILPVGLRAQDDFVLHGTIERIETDGRIRVDGHRLIVDDATEITDQVYRPVAPKELVQGVVVDVVCEETSRGARAKNVVATLMR